MLRFRKSYGGPRMSLARRTAIAKSYNAAGHAVARRRYEDWADNQQKSICTFATIKVNMIFTIITKKDQDNDTDSKSDGGIWDV